MAAAVVGLVLLAMAWVGASGRQETSDQIAWLNLGIVGVLVPAVAGRLWVLRSRRTVQYRVGMILDAADAVPLDVIGQPVRPHRLVTAAKMSRFHRPECLLVAGKALSDDSLAAHERAGRRPCEMCRP